jgi:hypothetical protein
MTWMRQGHGGHGGGHSEHSAGTCDLAVCAVPCRRQALWLAVTLLWLNDRRNANQFEYSAHRP